MVTLASLVLTLFTGALLHDYGVEQGQVEQARLVARMLGIEPYGLLDLLDETNAVEVRLTEGGGTETVVPSRLEPPILTDATGEGFFDAEGATRVMEVLGNVAARRVLVHDLLLPALLFGVPEVPRALVARTENLRREIVRNVTALRDIFFRGAQFFRHAPRRGFRRLQEVVRCYRCRCTSSRRKGSDGLASEQRHGSFPWAGPTAASRSGFYRRPGIFVPRGVRDLIRLPAGASPSRRPTRLSSPHGQTFSTVPRAPAASSTGLRSSERSVVYSRG